MQISPAYLLEDEIKEILLKIKVKMISFQDDDELDSLYKVLKMFNRDIVDDILYNLNDDTIRHLKIKEILDEANRDVKVN